MANPAAAAPVHQAQTVKSPAQKGNMLQRQCACGNHAPGGGECAECKKKREGATLQRSAFNAAPLAGAPRHHTEANHQHDFSLVPVRASSNSASSTRIRFNREDLPSPAPIQAKLAINQPGDRYEQEADRVAESVVSQPAQTSVQAAPPRIQRLEGFAEGAGESAPPSVDKALSNPGRPLEPVLRRDMEQRFNQDFSRVRVHMDADAERSVGEVNALAYTVGQNIVFGAGRFAPETQTGQRLLAHELTHVVQQAGSKEARIDQGNKTWIQRKSKEKLLSITRIRALEGQLDSAVAQLSDGTWQPVRLVKNNFKPGNYIFQLKRDVKTHYRVAEKVDQSLSFIWDAVSVFEKNQYTYAELVSVEIIPGDPYHKFFTSNTGKAATTEDKEKIEKAVRLLEINGVTEDELLLLEQKRLEAENTGQTRAEMSDPEIWAKNFVEQSQEKA
jgi:hypothetical protein